MTAERDKKPFCGHIFNIPDYDQDIITIFYSYNRVYAAMSSDILQ